MDLMAFARAIGGSVVAGCVVATVDGKRQYVYRNDEFTPKGRDMYNLWSISASKDKNRKGKRHD